MVLRFFLQVQNSFNAKDIAQAQSVIRGKKKEEQKNSIANQTRITPDIIHWVVPLPQKTEENAIDQTHKNMVTACVVW